MKKANQLTLGVIPLFLGILGCGGCSSSPERSTLPFEESERKMEFDSLWEQKFPGPITDLALAKKSGDLVVATIPDMDLGGKHLLTLVSKDGKKEFQINSPFPVKSLDITDDGSRIVVNNYDGKLVAYDRTGKSLWEAEGGCKPTIVNASQRIVCFHDDDTKASFAFDLYDFEGTRISRFVTRVDVLAMKVSADEKWLALAFSGGRISLLNAQFKVEKEQKVAGEVLDLGISSGEDPRLAVISIDNKKGEWLSVFEAKKALVASLPLSYHVEQVEIFPAGKLITLYGNSARGQYLAVHSANDATLQWQKLESRYADYSLAVRLGEDRILAGFEQMGNGAKNNVKSRLSRLVVLDLDGKLKADLPLKTAEGAYLYSFAYSQNGSLIGVGTDDKRLQLFELK